MSEKFSSLFNGILTESGLRKVGVHVDIAELKHKFDVTCFPVCSTEFSPSLASEPQRRPASGRKRETDRK